MFLRITVTIFSNRINNQSFFALKTLSVLYDARSDLLAPCSTVLLRSYYLHAHSRNSPHFVFIVVHTTILTCRLSERHESSLCPSPTRILSILILTFHLHLKFPGDVSVSLLPFKIFHVCLFSHMPTIHPNHLFVSFPNT